MTDVNPAWTELSTIDGCTTLPQLFRKRCTELGDRVAMREKEFGIWNSYTWTEYYQAARELGAALMAMGLQPKEVVSVLAENRKEWLFFDFAILCCGGVSNGVYTTDAPSQLQHICADSQTRFLVVEDEEQLDKYLEVKDQLPMVEKVIVLEDEGLKTFTDDKVMFISEMYELGRQNLDKYTAEWDARIDAVDGDDTAILVYTSGTTGAPKGAMIAHRNVLFQAKNAHVWVGDCYDEEIVSILPLCHIAERTFSVFLSLHYRWVVNFVEAPDTSFENTMEVSPTVFFGVPRMWEKMYSSVVIKIKEAVWAGRVAYEWAVSVGMAYEEARDEGRLNAWLRAKRWAAEKLVFHNLKVMLGLDRARIMFTGAAPVSPDLIRWYRAIGLDLYELYGQTECSGIASANRAGENRLGSVGKAVPHTDMKIAEDGEIVYAGPHIFKGYLNQPEKTAETVIEGWLHSGDVGAVDNEGYYKITDRKKDIIITAGGKNITPSEIENQLKFSPYISDAVIIGD
ncbi:MAG: AMP-dependent synthetase/ligase, partial [Parvibaculales bacterium]